LKKIKYFPLRAFLSQTHFHYRRVLLFSLHRRDIEKLFATKIWNLRYVGSCCFYTVSQSGCCACMFRFISNGCFFDSTLKIITNNLRDMAISAFCDFIRFDSCLYFLPKNDLFDRAADHDT